MGEHSASHLLPSELPRQDGHPLSVPQCLRTESQPEQIDVVRIVGHNIGDLRCLYGLHVLDSILLQTQTHDLV